MQVSVEQLEGLEHRMTVQIPADAVEQKVQSRLQSLSRKARIDGFRPGKVPLKLIKKMYGAQVRQEVLGEVMEQSFQDAIKDQQLRPAGGPKVEPIKLDEGQDFEYAATFEIFPEFTPNTIAGEKITRPVVEITEADIDAMIENLRKQRTEWRAVDRPAQEQDRVTLSFEGKLDGEDFPGNKAENTQVILGAGSMIAEFEQKLTGLSANSESEFDVQFPGDYHAKELADKSVRFKAQIHAVEEPELPAVDEAFIDSFGVEENSLDGLRAALRQNMERELQQAVKTNVKRQVMEAVGKVHDIRVPQVLVDAEIKSLAEQAGFPEQSDEKSTELKTKLFSADAKQRVKLGLIIAKFASEKEVKLDDARVQSQLDAIAASYQDSAEVIRWYRQNPRLMQGIYDMALEEQIVDLLLEEADIVEQTMSFDELMKSVQNRSATEVNASDQSNSAPEASNMDES